MKNLIKIVPDFFNKSVKELDKKYFPEVKYYRDNKNCTQTHYALELFNNGVIGYSSLIKKLATACKDSKENIHTIISQFIQDFGNYIYKL